MRMASQVTIENNRVDIARHQWLDALKGIAAILVAVSHLQPAVWVYVLITAVMLPLFFVATGYTFHTNRNFVEFLRICIFRRLMVPLFFLSLAPFYILKRLVWDGDPLHAWDFLWEILCGKRLWYLYCSIFAQIIFYWVLRLTKRFFGEDALLAPFAVCCLLATIGFVAHYFGILKVFRLNTACIVQLYLFMGYYLKKKPCFVDTLLAKRPKVTIGACALGYAALALLTLFLFPGQYFDLNRNQYPNIAIVLGMIILGNLALVILARRVKLPKVLAYIGKNSLIYYCFHAMFFDYTRQVFGIVKIRIEEPILEKVIIFCVSMIGCAICSEIINRFAPFATGRGRAKQKV